MGMGTADVRDVVLASMHRQPLGQLDIGGDKGKVISGVTSERTSAWVMRSRAVAGMGGGSTGAVSAGTRKFMGNINISRTIGEST